MDLDNNLKKWIVVYTKPRHEKIVANDLVKSGFEVYLPLLKERRKWSDRKRWVEYPLFKSYVFVRIEIKNSIFVLKTSSVVKIVKFGKDTAIVDNSIIKAIKLMINGGYIPQSTDYFIKGDPVKVIEGPLKGIEGEIAEIQYNSRLIIRIDSIQHSISIKINPGFVSKIV